MKRIIIILICLVTLPLISLAWVGTSGSSETGAGYYDKSTMDKLSFDQGLDSWKVTLTSFGCSISLGGEVINSSDTLTHERLLNIYNELFAVARSSWQSEINDAIDEMKLALFGVARSTGIDKVIDNTSAIGTSLYGISRSSWQQEIYNELFAIARSSWQNEIYDEMFSLARSSWQAQLQLDLFSVARSSWQKEMYNQMKTSVTVADKRFSNVVSSGTSGKITGATTQTITITGNATKITFIYVNQVDTMDEAIVNNSITGNDMYFIDGIYYNEPVDIPQAVTLKVTLPVESTMYYYIPTVE